MMGMERGLQSLFMLIVTIAVGALFIIRVPPPRDEQIERLERQIEAYETVIAGYQNPPTATPGRATVDPNLLAPNPATGGISAPSTNLIITEAAPNLPVPTLDTTLALVQPGANTDNGQPMMQSVLTTLEVDPDGCALNPRTVFTTTERIVGVGHFLNMRAGDRITVRFFYNDTSLLIFEEVFTVQLAGNFCRWYDIVPDEIGWDVGSYSVAYQINNDPPVVADFTIGVLSGTATAP